MTTRGRSLRGDAALGLALVILLFHPAAATTAPARPDPRGTWPLDPRPEVVARFDPPAAPWAAGHRGVDLAGSPGQAVRAALSGQVGFVGVIAGKPVVTVVHGARRTTYEPVVGTLARGTRVAEGAVIGRLSVAGGHCFPAACLHWGLREGDTYLDPLLLVGGGPVRLLPLWQDEPADAPSAPPRRPVTALQSWRRPLDTLP